MERLAGFGPVVFTVRMSLDGIAGWQMSLARWQGQCGSHRFGNLSSGNRMHVEGGINP
jgi:hypothetical protein